LRLQRYVLTQLLATFAIAAAGMLFVALPGLAVGAVHKLPGVGTGVLLRYLPLATGVFVPYVVPVAFLLAIVSTYGRLAADREWLGIQMAGVHPLRMLLSPLLLGLAVGAGTYAMNAEVLPRMKYEQKIFQVRAVRDSLRSLNPGRTELNFGDFYLAAGYRQGTTFHDVFMEIPPLDGQPPRTVLADSVQFRFTDDHMYVHIRDGVHVHDRVRARATPTIVVPFERLVDDPGRSVGRRYLTSGQLLDRLEQADLDPKERRNLLYEWHSRMAVGATCLAFILLGVPTGILMKHGTRMGALAVAVGYAMAYWLVSLRLGKELGSAGIVPPWVGAWGPVLLSSLAGAVLCWRAFRR
jgi:lipopolysaccharide export system permease protein